MDIESVNQVIDKLAEKLSLPAGKMMELLPAVGIRSVVECLFGVVVLVVGILCCRRAIKQLEEDNYDIDNKCAVMVIVGSVFIFLGGIFAFLSASDTVLWVYNPQAWALSYIFGKL